MQKKNEKTLIIGVSLLIMFIVWTILLSLVDVRAVGPKNSSVGFSSFNMCVHNMFGVNMKLYVITDWFGLVPVAVGFGFAVFGLVQWIKRKNILKVDKSILALGMFYIIVIGVYILFEIIVINYRPVLINGYLEASYPSSTTMLVMCVMPTAIFQFNARIKNKTFKRCIIYIINIFIAFMVIGRLLSGVHWITDIIGGGIFSTGIVLIYYSICKQLLKF